MGIGSAKRSAGALVQFVTLRPERPPRPDIARAWVKHLSAAVRKVDDPT